LKDNGGQEPFASLYYPLLTIPFFVCVHQIDIKEHQTTFSPKKCEAWPALNFDHANLDCTSSGAHGINVCQIRHLQMAEAMFVSV